MSMGEQQPFSYNADSNAPTQFAYTAQAQSGAPAPTQPTDGAPMPGRVLAEGDEPRRFGRLGPARHKGYWVTGGLALQFAGIALPIYYAYRKAKHLGVTDYTVGTMKLVWKNSLHTKTGMELLIAGAVIFAVGSVILARPYTKSIWTLLLGVPVAAVAGVLVLGVIAVVVVLLWIGVGDWPSSSSSTSKKKPETDSQAQAQAQADMNQTPYPDPNGQFSQQQPDQYGQPAQYGQPGGQYQQQYQQPYPQGGRPPQGYQQPYR